MITVVLPYRNRDKLRLDNCLGSLAGQAVGHSIILVDYGSDAESKAILKKLPSVYPSLKIITVAAEKWKKTHANNIGLREVSSKYVLFSDIDMCFQFNFLQEIQKELELGSRIVTCKCFYLPRSETRGLFLPIDWPTYNPQIEQISGETAVGACLAVETAWAKSFDESYRGWGREDYDFLSRAKLAGLTHVWVTNRTRFFHQWHPPLEWKLDKEAILANTRYFDEVTVKQQLIVRNPNGWGLL
jgi:GT2 family glycosyltransferase